MTILKIENLRKSFGGVLALCNVSFDVEPCTILGIIGPNGSGKTTFFNLVTGFLRPDRGQITYETNDITRYSSYQIASLGIVRTYQNTSLFDNLTVSENVRIATHTKTKSGVLDAIFKTAKTKRDKVYVEERISELLYFTGLGGKEEEWQVAYPMGNREGLRLP